ncbi:MAG: MipA/OmpV family protein [Desulfamplus sp.]|nr:MipA/OmpV family protein [Desulfamplus sp.]
MEKFKLNCFKVSVVICLCIMLGVFKTEAEELPGIIRAAIEREFPGAAITEVSEELYKGEIVTEVELIKNDGTPCEVHLSKDGTLVKVEEKNGGVPLIGGELSIGLAGLWEDDIYKGVDSEFQPAPFLRYEKGPFEVMTHNGINATLKIFGTRDYSLALKGSILLEEGYDVEDSVHLKGMDELETLYYTGLEFQGEFADWEISLEVLQDVSGEHDGQDVELGFEYKWTTGAFEFRPSLSLTWMSKETVDYSYGVSAREANATRPAYSPSSSYEIEAELMVQRPIYGNFKAVGIASVSTFGKEIKDSPLVDKDYAVQMVLGVIYTF